MEGQEIRYRVGKKVYRRASLYAMFMRNRNTFRIGIAVVLGVAVYAAFASEGVFELNYLPIYIAAAYLIWMLILLGREEQNVLRYLKSEDTLLGKEFVLHFDETKLSIDIPEKKLHTSVQFAKLASAVEISGVFMLYISAEQLYLVPTDAMSDAQQKALRRLLRKHIGKKFVSTVTAREKK